MLRRFLLPSYELKKTRRADLNSVITNNTFTSRRSFMWSVVFRYIQSGPSVSRPVFSCPTLSVDPVYELFMVTALRHLDGESNPCKRTAPSKRSLLPVPH